MITTCKSTPSCFSAEEVRKSCSFFRRSAAPALRFGCFRTPRAAVAGTVLFLAGRSEFIEKYAGTYKRLSERGFDVFTFDWRGQGLSQRSSTRPASGFIQSYNEYLDDLHQFVNVVVLPRKRGNLVILAHSMGGHIALRYMAQRGGADISAAVISAPMIDIVTAPLPVWAVRPLSRVMTAIGCGRWHVSGSGRFNPFRTTFQGNRLTSDRGRFEWVQQLVKQYPELSAGAVTYGWLAATFESIDILQRADHAASISLPVLLLLAGRDRVVDNSAARRFAGLLPDCRVIVVEEARHEILQEQDRLQNLFWRAFNNFLG